MRCASSSVSISIVFSVSFSVSCSFSCSVNSLTGLEIEVVLIHFVSQIRNTSSPVGNRIAFCTFVATNAATWSPKRAMPKTHVPLVAFFTFLSSLRYVNASKSDAKNTLSSSSSFPQPRGLFTRKSAPDVGHTRTTLAFGAYRAATSTM